MPTADEDRLTYEGRPLARPAEELTDQGLGFDVATVWSRRNVLRSLGLGAATIGLTACGATGTSPTPSMKTSAGEIPDETAGPYPGDGSNGPDVLEQSGIVRRDIRSSFGGATGQAAGVPVTLELVIKDLAHAGAAFAGVAVYVWHCNREGEYSLYSAGVTDENYLRGVQIADQDGRVTFTSIFPACYPGRWPHIHFEIYPDQASITDDSAVIATSQLALPKEVCETVYAEPGYAASVGNLSGVTLESDNVFGDDGGGSQLATVTGDVGAGYTVSLQVGVDPRTTPTGGRLGGDGAPSGAPGGRPGGPPPSVPPPGGRAGGPPSGGPPSGGPPPSGSP